VILKTTNTFRIEVPLTVTLVARVSILCRLFISKYTPTERIVHIQYLYNSWINSVATCSIQSMMGEVAALGHKKHVPLQVKISVLCQKSLFGK
jgi:hypothetical protein